MELCATDDSCPQEGNMRWSMLAAVSISPLMMFPLAGLGGAQAPEGYRISGPIVHESLAVYFIHGRSAPGKVPLTLAEAMAKGTVKVRETSNVNQLEIENLGHDEVFVQSGDIVKGGKQDRTLMVSLLLPPNSGSVPIASFCVEEGRWTARGREDAKNFATASASVPSREMKLAMKAPMPAAACGPARGRRSGPGAGRHQRDRVRDRRASAAGVGERAQDPGQADRQPRRAGPIGAVGLEPAACAREREADGRAEGLYQSPAGGGRERRRRHRLRLCGQRRAQQCRCLSLQRPVPEDVDEAPDRQRDRGHRSQG